MFSKENEADTDTALNELFEQLDDMDFGELLNYLEQNVQHRDIIINLFMIEKYNAHLMTALVVSDISFTESEVTANSDVILYEGESSSSLSLLAEIIQNIKIICHGFDAHDLEKIIEVLNEHSTESLANVIFQSCNEDEINLFKGKFDNVERVSLFESRFEENKICHLNEVFPSITRLHLEYSDDIKTKCVEQHFSKLHHLEYLGSVSNENGDINEMFRLNAHLKSIALWNKLDENFLSSMSQSLPEIETLRFHVQDKEFFNLNAYHPAHFKSLKTLHIVTDFDYHHEPQKLPFTCDELEVFNLARFDISDHWIDIITQYKQLKSLKIRKGIVNDEQWNKIAKELPELHNVTTAWSQANADGITHFMENSKNLKIIFFTDIGPQERRAARRAISFDWKVDAADDFFYFYKEGEEISTVSDEEE